MAFVDGPLPQRLKFIHGFGAVAFGVKDSGFSFFLLIFYNQVLGMDAGLVSLALGAALLVDAVIDPILGNLSDRTYTRWGRRLPWLGPSCGIPQSMVRQASGSCLASRSSFASCCPPAKFRPSAWSPRSRQTTMIARRCSAIVTCQAGSGAS